MRWEGKVKRSQRLKDLIPFGATSNERVSLRTNRKRDDTGVHGGAVRAKNGSWVIYSEGGASNSLVLDSTGADDISSNVSINIKQSLVALGYSSLAEFALHGAIKLPYNGYARRFNQANYVTYPLFYSDTVKVCNSGLIAKGLFDEFLNTVQTRNNNVSNLKPATSISVREPNNYIPVVRYDDSFVISKALNDSILLLYPTVKNVDGKLWLVCAFKEVIVDNGSMVGDSGIMNCAISGVRVGTDDSGNKYFEGTLAHNMNIPA